MPPKPRVLIKPCAAIKCTNHKVQNPDLSFFRFPAQDERCRRWVQFCRREDLIGKDLAVLNNSVLLCEQHFEANQFTRPDLKGCEGRKRLIKTAVPTIFHELSNLPPPSITPTRSPPKKRRLTPEPDTGVTLSLRSEPGTETMTNHLLPHTDIADCDQLNNPKKKSRTMPILPKPDLAPLNEFSKNFTHNNVNQSTLSHGKHTMLMTGEENQQTLLIQSEETMKSKLSKTKSKKNTGNISKRKTSAMKCTKSKTNTAISQSLPNQISNSTECTSEMIQNTSMQEATINYTYTNDNLTANCDPITDQVSTIFYGSAISSHTNSDESHNVLSSKTPTETDKTVQTISEESHNVPSSKTSTETDKTAQSKEPEKCPNPKLPNSGGWHSKVEMSDDIPMITLEEYAAYCRARHASCQDKRMSSRVRTLKSKQSLKRPAMSKSKPTSDQPQSADVTSHPDNPSGLPHEFTNAETYSEFNQITAAVLNDVDADSVAGDEGEPFDVGEPFDIPLRSVPPLPKPPPPPPPPPQPTPPQTTVFTTSTTAPPNTQTSHAENIRMYRRNNGNLRVKLCRARKKIKQLKELTKNVVKKPVDLLTAGKQFLSTPQMTILALLLRDKDRKGFHPFYTENQMNFALALYYRSKDVYKYLSDIMPLPSESQIRRRLAGVETLEEMIELCNRPIVEPPVTIGKSGSITDTGVTKSGVMDTGVMMFDQNVTEVIVGNDDLDSDDDMT